MSIFNRAASNRPKLNAFDLTQDYLTSVQMGKIIPVQIEEVVPGDRWRKSTDVLVRVNPLSAPVMSKISVKTETFYVPNRIIWDKWEDFISRGRDGMMDIELPTVDMNNLSMYLETISEGGYGGGYVDSSGTLADYMGIPILPRFTNESEIDGSWRNSMNISLLPFAAYQRIYNDYYRNPNLEDEINLDLKFNNAELYKLRTRQWGRDYFTTALPWVQRGPEVNLPITGDAPITGLFAVKSYPYGHSNPDGPLAVHSGGESLDYSDYIKLDNGDLMTLDKTAPEALRVDLSDVSAVTINDLRKASAIQRWFEQAARVGSRYIDMLQGFFGVRPMDLRLDRPALIGSHSTPIRISEVLQTESTTVDSPQGNMSGHGLSYSENFDKDYEIQDFGFIVTVLSIVPKADYMQGVRKFWVKNDPFEFYFPQFSQLGEQPVKNSELFYTADSTEEEIEGTFGYQSRYAEYKFCPNMITGAFRDSLDFWHFGRKFDNLPKLNQEFVEIENITRPFPLLDPEPGEENFYVQVRHHNKVLRPIPVYNIPNLN